MAAQEFPLVINYVGMMRTFGNSAVGRMEQFARSHNAESLREVYGMVAELRVALQCLDTTSDESKLAFKEFRDKFDAAADKMYDRLNQLEEG